MLLAEWRDPISVSDIVVALAMTNDPGEGSMPIVSRRALPAPQPQWITQLAQQLSKRQYTDAVKSIFDASAAGAINDMTAVKTRGCYIGISSCGLAAICAAQSITGILNKIKVMFFCKCCQTL